MSACSGESAILCMRPIIALLLIMISKSCLPLDLGPPETWAIACSVLHPGATASIVAPELLTCARARAPPV